MPRRPSRRRFLLGSSGLVAVLGGSFAHQKWLNRQAAAAPAASGDQLPQIPVFDARNVGLVGFATARRTRMIALRDACIGPLTPLAKVSVTAGDQLAAHWLHRSGSPYADEVDAIAQIAGTYGVPLLNTSYEWGCTALAAPSAAQDSARLLRSLDWSFDGLGRLVEVVRQEGPAGEFWNVTWPGAAGVLTAMAPGRFAASINQAPYLQHIESIDAPSLDSAINAWRTYFAKPHLPAMHLLRQVFETAPDYRAAQARLEATPLANATIFTLVGLGPDETCVIERTREDHATRSGIASAANDWQYGAFPGNWQGIGEDDDDSNDQRGDNDERSAAIEKFAGRPTEDFAWLQSPILNGNTRLAVEADPRKGELRVRGYETAPDEEDSANPVTATLDLQTGI
ncbi:hypothetical protein SAMN05444161_3438 [Rhizobiales bacterium GAS191]|nr:hypothetical protein SAMN05444161_3438 [Rhizobiales bacterium GAS191]